ncbi:MAG: hypothetical protein MMC33_003390 [Icmadophila ericetorum]|nr:hypothetical protein [Icmadophila ericetorum]
MRNEPVLGNQLEVLSSDGSVVRAELGEPLALEAAMECFVKEKPELCEERLRLGLLYLQDNSAGFGNAAESYLAWKLCTVLGQRENKSDELIPRMDATLREFEKAVRVQRNSKSNVPSKLVLGAYSILQGEKIGQVGGGINGDASLKTWLEEARFYSGKRSAPRERPETTAHFPSPSVSGPDLLFFLEPPIDPAKESPPILCLIQLKTGKVGGDQFKKAARTSGPELWLERLMTHAQEREHDYGEVYAILKDWKKLRYLRLLIAASGLNSIVAPRDLASVTRKNPAKQSNTTPKRVELRQGQYWHVIGKESAETILGSWFCNLLELMKTSDAKITY